MLARLLAPRLASLPLPLRALLPRRRGALSRRSGRAGQREFYQIGAELLGVAGRGGRARGAAALPGASPTAGGGGELQVVLGFAGALDDLLLAAGADDPAALAAAVARRERGEVRRACPALLEVVENGAAGPAGGPRRPEAAGRLAGPARPA